MYIQKVYISKTADTLQTFQNIQLYGVTAPSTVFAALFFISNYFFKNKLQLSNFAGNCKLHYMFTRNSCNVLQETIATFSKIFLHSFARYYCNVLQDFLSHLFSCTVLQEAIATFCKIFLHSFAKYYCNVLQDFLAQFCEILL